MSPSEDQVQPGNVVNILDVLTGRTIDAQKKFLRDMLEHLEGADDVDRIAFAVLVRFKDGSTAIQASGFSSDSEAQRYFEAVMRGRLGFAG